MQLARESAPARSAPERGCFGDDGGDDRLEILEHVLIRDAEDCPAQLDEQLIPPRIRPCAVLVIRTIDLDDEADLGAGEVHDEGADDELPTEGEPGLELERRRQSDPSDRVGAKRMCRAAWR